MFKEPEKGNEDVKDIRIKQALETNDIIAACPFAILCCQMIKG